MKKMLVLATLLLMGAGCDPQQPQVPPAAQEEAETPTAAEPSPEPTTPDERREASTPAISEIVVTKQLDSAGSVPPPTPAPTSGGDTKTIAASANVSPASSQVLEAADALKPITFRWTPIVPKPKEPVTYRLKVWQLMQGQNSTQAMRTNQPIVTKDVDNLTQATVSGIYTGPCKPPYLCDYVWGVEAMSGGVSVGMSEITAFSVAAEATTTPGDDGASDGTR